MARVRVTVNRAELGRTIYGSGSQAQRLLDEKAQQLARNIRAKAPTSELASSVRVENSSELDLQFGRPNFTGTTRGRRIVVDHNSAKALETGTGPAHETLNRTPDPNDKYWPSPYGDFFGGQSLIEWAYKHVPEFMRHVRPNKNGTLNIYLLQKAIHDNGTPARHFVLASLEATFPNARGKFARE